MLRYWVFLVVATIGATAHAESLFGFEYTPVGDADVTQLGNQIQVRVNNADGDNGVHIDPGTALSARLTVTDRTGRFNTIQTVCNFEEGGKLTTRVVNDENPLAVDGLEWVESAAQNDDKGAPVPLATEVTVLRDGEVVYTTVFPAGWNTYMFAYPKDVTLTHAVQIVQVAAKSNMQKARHDAMMATVQSIRIAAPGGGEDIELLGDTVQFLPESDAFGNAENLDDVGNFGEVGDTVQFNPLAAAPFDDDIQLHTIGAVNLLCTASWPDGQAEVTSAGTNPPQAIRLTGVSKRGVAITMHGDGAIADEDRALTFSGNLENGLQLLPVTFDTDAGGIATLFLDPSAVSDVGAVEVVAALDANTVAVVPFASVPDFLASGVDTTGNVVIGYQVDSPSGSKASTPLVADDILLYLEFPTSSVAIAGGQPVTANRLKVRCPDGACRPSKAIPPSIKGLEVTAPSQGLTITDIETYGTGETGDDLGLDPFGGGFVEAGDNVCLEIPNALATAIQWDRDGEFIPLASSRRLCLSNLQPSDSGIYRATFDDGSGKAIATYSVTITVVGALPASGLTMMVLLSVLLALTPALVLRKRRA